MPTANGFITRHLVLSIVTVQLCHLPRPSNFRPDSLPVAHQVVANDSPESSTSGSVVLIPRNSREPRPIFPHMRHGNDDQQPSFVLSVARAPHLLPPPFMALHFNGRTISRLVRLTISHLHPSLTHMSRLFQSVPPHSACFEYTMDGQCLFDQELLSGRLPDLYILASLRYSSCSNHQYKTAS